MVDQLDTGFASGMLSISASLLPCDEGPAPGDETILWFKGKYESCIRVGKVGIQFELQSTFDLKVGRRLRYGRSH